MKALVVYNPFAGMAATRASFERALDVLRARGWELLAQQTQAQGEATRLAREAALATCDAVIAVGGDGTINEVANGLVHSKTALGVLPLGTVNVWAREMGLPLDDLPAAAHHLADAEARSIDVGEVCVDRAAPRVFVLWCGVGFDALIVKLVEPQRDAKRRFGALVFWLVGLKEAWGYRGRRMALELDGQSLRRRVILALASNTQLYGGVVRIATEAKLDDGLLDVVVLNGTGVWHTLWHLINILLGRHVRDPEAELHRARHLVIRARHAPVQVDGELIGMTPVDIRIVPRGLRILVPRGANRNLFGSETI